MQGFNNQTARLMNPNQAGYNMRMQTNSTPQAVNNAQYQAYNQNYQQQNNQASNQPYMQQHLHSLSSTAIPMVIVAIVHSRHNQMYNSHNTSNSTILHLIGDITQTELIQAISSSISSSIRIKLKTAMATDSRINQNFLMTNLFAEYLMLGKRAQTAVLHGMMAALRG